MMEKEQFDSFLGGSQDLPAEVSIFKLASSRATEIAAMGYSIDNPQQTKLIFQKLPIHMRRRVMSHNAKRMPRRLQESHIRQMSKSGLPPKNKRPSRKHRRRPKNLLAAYKRRQSEYTWMETHIWHAKRFHMIKKWGYKIPDHSNNRCFRSSYRAVAKHCLIQDISYYSCLEITGPFNSLTERLSAHCDPTRLSFSARSYSQGTREGSLMFFEKNGYPKSPIGTVQFVWRPSERHGIENEDRTIWIWSHPSFYQHLLQQLCDSFGFRVDHPLDKDKNGDDYVPQYTGVHNCRLILLRDQLIRFRLTGPLSLAVLTDSLRLPELGGIVEDTKKGAKRDKESSDPDSDVEIIGLTRQVSDVEVMDVEEIEKDTLAEESWNVNYYRSLENFQSFKVQKEVFEILKNLKSPSQLPPGIIMAFTVLDPRFFHPRQRTKSQTNAIPFETMPAPPTLANFSPIWESGIRKSILKNFKPTSEINKLRSEALVPGVGNDDQYDQEAIDKVPILLIQRPGCSRKDKGIGFSSGIDVVLPSGWAVPFWISFILRCTKPGGLRELKSIIFENLSLNSPDFNPPDSLAYSEEAAGTKYSLLEKYFRYPPNRRVNYVKLGISSPFVCEWNLLVKEWTGLDGFHVLRDQKLLNYLNKNLESLHNVNRGRKIRKINNENNQLNFDRSIFPVTNCLVCVKISMQGRGCPRDFAVVCLPVREDLEKLNENENWAGPVEKIRPDPNESTRKKLKRGHLALLRRLRRQRLRQHKKTSNVGLNKINQGDAVAKALVNQNLKKKALSVVEKQAEIMKNLYLPKCKTVRHSCDREVMGYVVKGDFSFTESKGIGLAYICLTSIFDLVDTNSSVVLIRNTKTRQYRSARISILS
ncbi:ribonucleases P/MRP protein subunit POP1 [Athalia rosae]|uniref:ribonucleases P/MRP protein subunit POP1 n=1 Tax=Athalia rosae TaxID=37344 RepID=UPI002034478C|nr:ribonucleases P/MRP protein subunit POP1 [Athalia rosae]